MSKNIKFAAFAAVATGLCVSAQAQLVFNTTYDKDGSGVSSLPYFAQMKAAMTYTEGLYSALYNNNITINIDVESTNSSGALGGSSTALQGFNSYAQVKGFLAASATSADDFVSVASLPALDPTPSAALNGGFDMLLPDAEAKALGARGATDPGRDGTFTFGTDPNFLGSGHQEYTFDPSNRAVANEFDFIGVASHEISEIMGRIPGLGNTFGQGFGLYLPFDLFRFTAAGTRNFSNPDPSGVYFSIDGGVTKIKGFNSNAVNGPSDPQDWDAADPGDAYDAFLGTDQKSVITNSDVRTMDILGYNLAPVPEPTTLLPVGLLVGGFGLRGLRRRSK